MLNQSKDFRLDNSTSKKQNRQLERKFTIYYSLILHTLHLIENIHSILSYVQFSFSFYVFWKRKLSHTNNQKSAEKKKNHFIPFVQQQHKEINTAYSTLAYIHIQQIECLYCIIYICGWRAFHCIYLGCCAYFICIIFCLLAVYFVL